MVGTSGCSYNNYTGNAGKEQFDAEDGLNLRSCLS
jgi:hypothetical protein